MEISAALTELVERRNLDQQAAYDVFTTIMSGDATSAQIGGILMALRIKGETVAEIAGAAQAMRALSTKVNVEVANLVDTCGTGGSGQAKLFNISTAAAFVAAAAGAHVAKHGNRAMTSKSGSADVLEAAGVNLNLTPTQIGRCIAEVGVGFMFAQAHHSAMRHAGPVRQELGVPTIFNVLGPLTNPADAKRQVIGVFSADWQRTLAEVAQRLGSEHVLVVHAGGLDEISVAGASRIVELSGGEIEEYEISPADFGLGQHDLNSLRASSPEQLNTSAFGVRRNPPTPALALAPSGAQYSLLATPDIHLPRGGCAGGRKPAASGRGLCEATADSRFEAGDLVLQPRPDPLRSLPDPQRRRDAEGINSQILFAIRVSSTQGAPKLSPFFAVRMTASRTSG